MPGTLGGALIIDRLGPKYTMVSKQDQVFELLKAPFSHDNLDYRAALASRHRVHHEWGLRAVSFVDLS